MTWQFPPGTVSFTPKCPTFALSMHIFFLYLEGESVLIWMSAISRWLQLSDSLCVFWRLPGISKDLVHQWHPTPVLLPGNSHGWRSLEGCSPWGLITVGHDWATSLSLFSFMHWRRKWQPSPVFLPGESQGQGSLVGCRPWGHRVRHNWSNLAAAAAIRASPADGWFSCPEMV